MASTDVHNYSTYVNHGCRCDVCRDANRAYNAKRRAERYALVAEAGLPSAIAHGRAAYTNWGCRCALCSSAHSAADSGRRSGSAS